MSDTRSAAANPPPKPVAPAVASDASSAMTLFVMLVATLYFGKEVLVPVTLASLLAFLLAPLVGLFRRARLGRVPSVLLGLIIALGVILGIGSVIWTQLAELSNDLPRYAATIETKAGKAQSYTFGRLSQLADRVGVQRGRPGSTPDAATSSQPEKTPPQVSAPATSSQLDLLRRYLSPVLSPLATLGIVFIVAIFALLQQEDLRDRLIRLLGSDDLHRTTFAIDDGARRLSKYFLTQFSINVGFGIVIGLGLLIIGVPNPILWGTLSALLRLCLMSDR
jgi:predicted PurR-regulated permease PerM